MKILVLILGLILPVGQETEALKVRATAFLETLLKQPAAALVYVEEESRPRFLEFWGKGIPSYEVGDIQVSGDRGTVIAKIERVFPLMSATFKVPFQLEWVRKAGEWSLHIPEVDKNLTPFGRSGGSGAPSSGASSSSMPMSPPGIATPESLFQNLGIRPLPVDHDLVNRILAKEQEDRERREIEEAARLSQPAVEPKAAVQPKPDPKPVTAPGKASKAPATKKKPVKP